MPQQHHRHRTNTRFEHLPPPTNHRLQPTGPQGLLEEGNRRRKTEATDANAQSSRSHAVLEIAVKRSPKNHYRVQQVRGGPRSGLAVCVVVLLARCICSCADCDSHMLLKA